MIGLLNTTITEYASTASVGPTGEKSLSYSHYQRYPARLEPLTREKAMRIFGLDENVEYRMFTLRPPVLGNFILVDGRYLRIMRCLPMLGQAKIHHYEAAVG